MIRRQSSAASVSPAWSFAQWPLKRKLFAALVFPVGLSFVLGGVAVQNDFEQAAQLANAADSTLQVRPVVEYNIAVQALAAAESVGGGGVISAITKYESAAANLRIALKSDTVSDKVRADAEDALGLGNAVRAAKTQQSFSATVVDKSASTASVLSTMVGDLALSDDADSAKTVAGLQDTLASQRAMVGQQLNLGNAADSSAGMSALKQVGAEASFLTRLRGETGQANSADVHQLINENERRGLSLGGALDAATLTQLGEGYERSNAAYRSMLDRQLTELETTLRTRADVHRQQAVLNAALILTALLAALLIVIRLMRSLLNPIRAVRQGALDIARHKLPEAVARIRDGQEPEQAQPIPVHTTEEMGQLARAVDDLHSQALSLAGEQARLRVQVNSMFETLSRRSTSLVDQQLSLIERLERDEQDPKRLQSLFRLDHLAARMRRNSDSLLVLAGTSTRRGLSGSVSIADTVRAAVSEVENYERIDIGDTSDDHVLGSVGSDLIHLLAELVDNALAYSPPTTRVSIRGARTSHGGLLVEVTDRGLGMPPEELAALNERLATGGDVTVDTARRMGLFVVGNLAQRHGVLVRLRRNAEERSGITVSVQLPAALLENRGGKATDAPAATAAGSAATAAAGSAATPAAGTVPAVAAAPKPAQATNGHAQPTRSAPAIGRAAPASAPAASLEPLVIPGQSGPSADTTSSLPKRTPGQHGPVGSAPAAPAPAARSGLPKRTPGQHGPVESANAAADVAPAAAVAPASTPVAPAATEPAAKGGLPQRTPGQHGPVESAGAAAPAGPAPVAKSDLSQADLPQRAPTEQSPAEAKSGRSGPQRRLPGLFHSLRSGNNSNQSGAPASTEDSSTPDSPRSGGGLPVRKPNATRITELTGGPVTRPEGAEVDDTQPRMPANLSAWLDHRAALAAARAAREAEEAKAMEAKASGLGTDTTADDGAPSNATEATAAEPTPFLEGAAHASAPLVVASEHERDAEPVAEPDEDAEPATEPDRVSPTESLALPAAELASEDTADEPAEKGPGTASPASDGPTVPAALPRRRSGASGIDTSTAALGSSAAPARGETPRDDESADLGSPVVPTHHDAQHDTAETERPEAAETVDAPKTVEAAQTVEAPPTLPRRTPGASGLGLEPNQQSAAAGDPRRSQASAFFGARRAEAVPASHPGDTPIFRSMMSSWLTDGADEDAAGWSPTEADEGWSAAARVESAEPIEESSAGLPMRRPGDYLVPGAIEDPEHERATPVARTRDPEAIRRNLNRHHRGVSSARAEAQDAPHPREEADVHN